jgi:hypothetical protein
MFVSTFAHVPEPHVPVHPKQVRASPDAHACQQVTDATVTIMMDGSVKERDECREGRRETKRVLDRLARRGENVCTSFPQRIELHVTLLLNPPLHPPASESPFSFYPSVPPPPPSSGIRVCEVRPSPSP